MLKNYFLIALRNLLKHKVFSLINIVGLSVGIACCVLLALYIKDEFSYEKHFDSFENIYRITSAFTSPAGRNDKMPSTSPPIAMALQDEFPEVESATRLVNPPEVEQHLLRVGDKIFYEKRGYLVDSTFFDVFSYSFKEGDRTTALDAPSTVVLSEPVALKLFGSSSPIDQLISISSGSTTDTFRVTGVLAPFKKKSQVDADFYMSMNSNGLGHFVLQETTWFGNNFVYTYIKLREGASREDLIAKFLPLMEKHAGDQMKERGTRKILGLQLLADTRLYSAAEFSQNTLDFYDLGGGGNILYIYILGSICLFILLIACINFMNLTTAKASQRAGEVGVRKSLGASRSNLIYQFLGESLTIVAVGMLMAIAIVQLSLPLFNHFTQKDLRLGADNIAYLAAALVGISLVTGLVAGSYPAFFLSSFQPAKVLKDKRLSSGASNWLRQGLVVFQFVISITLISAIIIVYKQLNFIQHKSLGFDPQYRIMLPLRSSEAKSAYLNLKDRFEQLAGIRAVSGSTSLPSTATVRDIPLYPDGSDMEKAVRHFNINIDEDYFDLLDIPLIAGRDLVYEKDSFDLNSYSYNHILINRSSAKANGLTLEEAVGSTLHIDWQGKRFDFLVEGVVEDFHQLSMHNEVPPMIFFIPKQRNDFVNVCVAVDAAGYKNVLANMAKAWKEVIPNTPFESTLLSDNVKKQYEADQRVLSIITTFTLIAILISCLGLYGLSIYVAQRKEKEIGIRKILGASVTGIVSMLSKDFMKLVAIAFIISIPVGYYIMNLWLESFAYKTELDAIVFLLAGVISCFIAWITVGFESLRVALGNPVEALKNE